MLKIYADGILAAFDKKQDLLDFLNVLNKMHPNNIFMINYYDLYTINVIYLDVHDFLVFLRQYRQKMSLF